MTDERRAYHRMKRAFPQADWQRVENRVGSGAPDVNVCYKGVEMWVENKEGRLNLDGRVRAKIRPAQRAWATRRMNAGGQVRMALLVRKDLYILQGIWLKDFRWEKEGVPLQQIAEAAIPLHSLFDK